MRLLGTIAAFEVRERNLAILKEAFLQEGLLVRPIGNTVYILPPYSTTPGELQCTYRVIGAILQDTKIG